MKKLCFRKLVTDGRQTFEVGALFYLIGGVSQMYTNRVVALQ